MKLTRALVICLLVMVAGVVQGGEKLKADLEAVLNGPNYKHAHWGVLVVDLESGSPIFELNADKLFVPASTTKLFSVATALDALGADHRFRTPVYATGEIDKEGALRGDLVLVASGDLTMGGRTDKDGRIAFRDGDHTYANGNNTAALTEPDPLTGLNMLAKQVAEKGIKRIRGNVLIDDRLFDRAESTGSGPSNVTPVLINDNLLDFLITPGKEGLRASVAVRPETRLFQIDAQVETVARGKEPRIRITEAGPYRLVVRGMIPEGHKPIVRVHEVADAAAFARGLFIEALQRAGVSVDASPLAGNSASDLPPAGALTSEKKVAELESPTFAEEARLILKVSHNLHASTLPLIVAARNKQRTLADGLRLQHKFLKRAGVDVETISFGGGAGGSRADYTTPRATVQLLRYMATRPDFPTYQEALPVLGVDGTLASAVKADSPARGHIRAKTGTLLWGNTMNDSFLVTSKALAGYMTTSKGRKVAFAMFVNNTHIQKSSETSREGETLGKLCEIIYLNE